MCGAAVTAQAVYIDTGDCVMHVLSLEERHLWHKCVVQRLQHRLCTLIQVTVLCMCCHWRKGTCGINVWCSG